MGPRRWEQVLDPSLASSHLAVLGVPGGVAPLVAAGGRVIPAGAVGAGA